MHLSILDWAIIASFLIISLAIGLRFKKIAGKNVQNFFLGGRNLPWWIAGTSMVATTFAADTPLAVTELVGQSGISGNWLWWNMLAGGMLTTFFFAKYWRRANILTDVELIELRYSGKEAMFLRGFKAIYMGIFMNCLIIGWVNVAMMSILKVFFGIDYQTQLMVIAGFMLLTFLYSSISGLLGVVYTDVIQFVIAIGGCIILAVIVVNSDQIGGIEGLKSKLPSGSLSFFPNIATATPMETATSLTLGLGSFLAFITVQWWASWYPGNEPGGGGYIAQRMMSAKNEKHAIASTLFFQIAHYCIRPWPWIIVGLCSLVLYPELTMDDKKLGFVMAMKDFLPSGLKGLLLVAFFAAYMSTISTQLNWGASYLVNDFYKRFLNKSQSNKKDILVSRLATFVIMVIALYTTTKITSISGVWTFIMECGAGLGLVLILRWYWWRINAWSEIVATIAPFVGYTFARYYLGLQFPDSFFLTVGFTTVSWLLATLLTKPTSNEKLIAFYTRIMPGGAWGPVKQMAGISTTKKHPMGILLICWISGVILVYAALFFTGSLILQQWDLLAAYLFLMLVALASLVYFSRSIKIFED